MALKAILRFSGDTRLFRGAAVALLLAASSVAVQAQEARPAPGKPLDRQLEKPPEPPAAPVAPPIPLKFYGFVSATEAKRAFFLDGDDIVVAREGDVIKKRYKVMRIGLNSAIVEDEQFKSQQTLTLVQEQQEG